MDGYFIINKQINRLLQKCNLIVDLPLDKKPCRSYARGNFVMTYILRIFVSVPGGIFSISTTNIH